MTTNNQNTFYELFELFEKVFLELNIDPKALKQYINSRTNIGELTEHLTAEYGFEFSKEINETSSLRFASAEALFNHSIIRIAFLDSWKKLLPKSKWDFFVVKISELIDKDILNNGAFKATIPVTYLEFIKKEPNFLKF